MRAAAEWPAAAEGLLGGPGCCGGRVLKVWGPQGRAPQGRHAMPWGTGVNQARGEEYEACNLEDWLNECGVAWCLLKCQMRCARAVSDWLSASGTPQGHCCTQQSRERGAQFCRRHAWALLTPCEQGVYEARGVKMWSVE